MLNRLLRQRQDPVRQLPARGRRTVGQGHVYGERGLEADQVGRELARFGPVLPRKLVGVLAVPEVQLEELDLGRGQLLDLPIHEHVGQHKPVRDLGDLVEDGLQLIEQRWQKVKRGHTRILARAEGQQFKYVFNFG